MCFKSRCRPVKRFLWPHAASRGARWDLSPPLPREMAPLGLYSETLYSDDPGLLRHHSEKRRLQKTSPRQAPESSANCTTGVFPGSLGASGGQSTMQGSRIPQTAATETELTWQKKRQHHAALGSAGDLLTSSKSSSSSSLVRTFSDIADVAAPALPKQNGFMSHRWLSSVTNTPEGRYLSLYTSSGITRPGTNFHPRFFASNVLP